MTCRRTALVVLLFASVPALAQHAHMHDPRTVYTQGERLEYRDENDGVFWDLQGLYGGDYQRFVWKTEGSSANGDTDYEVQLLYGRAWTAFFDLQFGLRYEETDAGDVASAVAGLQGVLPYRVESDVALFVSDHGDVTGRAEFEKDFLLTERWVLQPRAELDVALQDIPELGIDAGVHELSFGLRLRYEIARKFAPYVGLAWEKDYGDAAAEGTTTSVVAGVRFWF